MSIILETFIVEDLQLEGVDESKLQLPNGRLWAHPWRNRDLAGWSEPIAARPGHGFNFINHAHQKASCLLINTGRWRFSRKHNNVEPLFDTGPDYFPSLHVRGQNFGDQIGSCVCIGW